jgi:predicted MFS family arabinose efflux permease
LLFLVYAAPGALVPLFSIRLTELGFSPEVIGLLCATQALGAILAPSLIGQVADRWFPAERCLSLCALLAGVLLWLLAELSQPVLVFWVTLGIWLCLSPAFTLGTSLCFTHLQHPERDFGYIRLWGTVGWMVPGWLLGYWFTDPDWLCWCVSWLRPTLPSSELPDAFRLAGACAVLLSIWALTIPPTPPRRHTASRWAPLAAIKLLRDRGILVYWLCVCGICLTFPFSSQLTPLLLQHLGIPRPWLSPTLTLSQASEVLMLALLPAVQMSLGTRQTLILGMSSWLAALCILTLGQPDWLVVGSLVLNGLVMAFFIVAGQIYLNGRARGDIRVSAQALLTFMTGLGMAGGHVLAGWIRRLVDGAFMPTFGFATTVAVALVVALALGFTEKSRQPPDASGEAGPSKTQ